MNKNKRLIYISLLAAQGVVITMLERAIPFPFAFAPVRSWGWRTSLHYWRFLRYRTKIVSRLCGCGC